MDSPDLSPEKMVLDVAYANRLLGVELTTEEVKKHLLRMRFGVDVSGDKLTVQIPPYRTDILHPIDLVEDIAIAYGYMNFKPEVPSLYQLGKKDAVEAKLDTIRDLLVGLGYSEVMSLILTNPKDLFERMNLKVEPAVEAVKPVSQEQSIARTWLLPSLMVVLEKNRNREYPQMLCEVGQTITASGDTIYKAAAVIAHSKTNFSEIKAKYCGLLKHIGRHSEDSLFTHQSFIEGRCAGDENGFYGEIHPQVLTNFGLEVPVTAFEIKIA
ncbi:MAG: hypothetical protein KKD39_00965 [Candidatus Altiarchaeota archaeon]|nr:hypothetical protein [Candidatus Altiarchaeota archaeon]